MDRLSLAANISIIILICLVRISEQHLNDADNDDDLAKIFKSNRYDLDGKMSLVNFMRKKRDSTPLSSTYPWDMSIYDGTNDGLAAAEFSTNDDGGGSNVGRFHTNYVASPPTSFMSGAAIQYDLNENNPHQHHHHHHHLQHSHHSHAAHNPLGNAAAATSTSTPITSASNGGSYGLIGPFGALVNPLTNNNPFQTNRLDFVPPPPTFYGGTGAGHAPVFLVHNQKSSGLTSWIWPLLIMLAFPFITGAAFIPLFLKSIVYLLQIGRNLGILFPLIPPVINGTNVG